MARERILVVEDEENIQELIRYNLAKEGYEIHVTGVGEEGIRLANAQPQDLVLLDLMLPGIGGLEVCRILKGGSITRRVPIIIVSARGEEADIVKGLELGADDYITKPFSPKILIARANAVLRRSKGTAADENALIDINGLVIDPLRFEVRTADNIIALTVTEFRVLHYLARHPGWVFTRYQIVDAVKGEDYPVTDRAVDVQIVGLRKKLGEFAHNIETVRGVGYRFKE